MYMNLSTIVKQEITFPNIVSISRPLTAYIGIEYIDEPIYQTSVIATAFLTDALDGILTKRFGQSKLGAYIDIFADRALEMVTMWSFAKDELISYTIPTIFTAKGLIVDSLRVLRDRKKGDFSNPLSYGNNENKTERFSYALIKGTYLSGVPILSSTINSILGVSTTAFGLYRGLKSVINKH